MTDIIRPGAGILFMKVGTHAREPLEDIIARKTREIERAGYGLWGYGGSTCHPTTMVQPFARSYEARGGKIFLCMEKMQSNHFAEQLRADECSPDGSNWEVIPPAISVLGSRYALVIQALRSEEWELPLAGTKVAVGLSLGRPGDQYISGRVDKACLEMADPSNHAKMKKISLVAELRAPYAVFLRNRN